MAVKKWISFDLDGTLMQNPFGRWVFPELDATVSRLLGRPYQMAAEMIREHEERLRNGDGVAAYDWDGILRILLQRLGIAEMVDIEVLVQKHSVTSKISLLEENTFDVLLQLKTAGYRIAAVTNGYRKYQYPVMKALGLAEWFDEIVTPEWAACVKPDIGMFRALSQSGRVVAHVGDRLDHDVLVANHYGCLSVLVYRSLPEELKGILPHERIHYDSMHEICLQKWKRENSIVADDLLPEVPKPDLVIHTLQELLPYLLKGGVQP